MFYRLSGVHHADYVSDSRIFKVPADYKFVEPKIDAEPADEETKDANSLAPKKPEDTPLKE